MSDITTPEVPSAPTASAPEAQPAATSAPAASATQSPAPARKTGRTTADAAALRKKRLAQKKARLAAAAASLPVVTKSTPEEPVKPLTPLPPLPPRSSTPPPSRIRKLLKSAAIWIGIPLILATLYYGLIASDQYVGKAQFHIRAERTSSMDGFSFLGFAANSGSAISDMYIVKEYIQSRQLIEDLKPRLDLKKLYSNPDADFLARFDPEDTDEEFAKYWKSMVSVQFDPTSGLVNLNVRAFTPKDAHDITREILVLSEALVNRLSDRARNDSLKLSKEEVDKAYLRVTESLDKLQRFAEAAEQIDPAGFAKLRGEIQSRLDSELVELQSQLDILRKSLPEDAPIIEQIKNRITVTEAQLSAERERATKSVEGKSATEILKEYEKLNLEKTFAEKAYMSALSSLEAARLETIRQARYLEAFVYPSVPDEAEHPRRLRNICLVGIIAFLIWATGGLIIAAAKEHL